MFFVYILKSTINGRHYIGTTQNVRRRLMEHNQGQSKSTAPNKPFVLKRVERFTSIRKAYARERFLKSKRSSRILAIIIKDSPDVLAEQEVGIPISR